MSDSAYIEGIMKQIVSSAADELEKVGAEIVADIKQRVADPYPPASTPFTPAHRRTGDYQAGWEHAVDENADEATATLAVTNDVFYAALLEAGTEKMAKRPAAVPTFRDWQDRVPQRLKDAVEKPAPVASPVAVS